MLSVLTVVMQYLRTRGQISYSTRTNLGIVLFSLGVLGLGMLRIVSNFLPGVGVFLLKKLGVPSSVFLS